MSLPPLGTPRRYLHAERTREPQRGGTGTGPRSAAEGPGPGTRAAEPAEGLPLGAVPEASGGKRKRNSGEGTKSAPGNHQRSGHGAEGRRGAGAATWPLAAPWGGGRRRSPGAPSATGAAPAARAPKEDAWKMPGPSRSPRAARTAAPTLPCFASPPLGSQSTEHRAEPEHTLSPSVRCCPPALTSRLSRLASMLRAMLSSLLAAAPAGRGPLSVPYRAPPPRGQPPPGSSPTGGTGARPRAALCPPGGGWRGAQPSGGGCPHRGESPLRGPGQPGSPRSPSQPGVGVGRQGRSCRCPASRGLGAAGHRGRCEC